MNNRNPVSDTLQDMLQDRADKTSPTIYQIEKPADKFSWGIGLWSTGLAFCLIGIIAMVKVDDTGVYLLLLGIVVTLVGWKMWANESRDQARDFDFQKAHLLHLQNLERDRLSQRVDAMNALKDLELARTNNATTFEVTRLQTSAQVEAAKYQALGAAGDKEFLREYAKLQHDWDTERLAAEQKHHAIEAKRDRRHEMDKLLERLDHEMDLWQERIKVEHRAEPERLQEELDAWELEAAARETIDAEEDEDKKIRLIKAFERRLSRNSQ